VCSGPFSIPTLGLYDSTVDSTNHGTCRLLALAKRPRRYIECAPSLSWTSSRPSCAVLPARGPRLRSLPLVQPLSQPGSSLQATTRLSSLSHRTASASFIALVAARWLPSSFLLKYLSTLRSLSLSGPCARGASLSLCVCVCACVTDMVQPLAPPPSHVRGALSGSHRQLVPHHISSPRHRRASRRPRASGASGTPPPHSSERAATAGRA
jgi:hypothetical protein